MHEAAIAGITACAVAVPGGWTPGNRTRAECRRLAGRTALSFTALEDHAQGDGALMIAGASLPPAHDIAAALAAGPAGGDGPGLGWSRPAPLTRGEEAAALRAAEKAVIRATAKPGDGIVSRYVNRPISQPLSRLMLRRPWVRPGHGTILNALVALAMALSLLLGGDAGLIAGAVLFQAASILDGVDGEIARATFRTSDRGAMLDSAVDAATNIGFIAGVVINVWLYEDRQAATIGAAGLACMAFGMLLLGLRARAMGVPLTFNAVKDEFNAQPSPLRRWLTWLTMRDFYAFAGALLIIAGLAGPGLVMFAVVAAGWLSVVIVTLLRQLS